MNIHLIRFRATFKWDLALFLSNEEKSPSIANHCKTLQQQPIFDQKMSDTRRRMRSYTVAVSSGGGVRSLEDLCVSGTSFVLSHLGKMQLSMLSAAVSKLSSRLQPGCLDGVPDHLRQVT